MLAASSDSGEAGRHIRDRTDVESVLPWGKPQAWLIDSHVHSRTPHDQAFSSA